MAHIPVLLNEVIEGLDIRQNANYIDATFGGGGYAKEILKKNGKVLAIDQNEDAIKRAEERIDQIGFDNWIIEVNYGFEAHASKASSHPEVRDEGRSEARSYEESEPHIISGPGPVSVKRQGKPAYSERLMIRQGNFSDIEDIALSNNFKEIKAIVFDLGLSTDLLESSVRGFSYMKDEPLLMTFSEKQDPNRLTALKVINSYEKDELERIFREYGEIRQSRTLAEKIIEYRRKETINTTFDLRKVIENSVKSATPKLLAQIWQAIRIEVNDELENLEKGLEGAWKLIDEGGKIAVVSFHSLEDRIVKNFFRDRKKESNATIITKKPMGPSKEEEMRNSRSRSAKLRIIKK